MDGTNLVATWREPFFLQGEQLSYVIIINKTESGIITDIAVNTTGYVLTEPIDGKRDCSVYLFILYSKNAFSRSKTGISRQEHIPTGIVL